MTQWNSNPEATSTVGLNQFADMTPREMREIYGLKGLLEQAQNAEYSDMEESFEALPS